MQQRKKKKNKMLPYSIAGMVVIIIVLVIGKQQGLIGKDFEIKVTSQVVESQTITESVSANGKIQPETEIKISPDVSGEIIELYVEEGGTVREGQLLAVIKPDTYEQALNRAQASLSSSRAMLAQSQARFIENELAFSRSQKLYNEQTISESEYESAEAAYKVAEAEVRSAEFSIQSAEASVAEAQEELTKTKIYAPMNGTVSRLNVEKGERVVGTNMYEGTEMMVIANLNQMEVKVEVNENDIVKVSKNDTALVEVDAYLNRKFRGIITEIANSASTVGASTDQVTSFDVKVLLLRSSYEDLIDSATLNIHPFRPGMSATVDILTETRENVISIPIQAVTTRVKEDDNLSEEKEEIVFVLKDNRAWERQVVTGIQDNMNIEILSGLSAGEEIITGPYSTVSRNLSDSTLVRVVDEEELYSDAE